MGGLEKLSQLKSSQVVKPSDFSKFSKLVTLFVNMNIHDPINWWVIFWPKYLELSILSCLKMAQSLVRSSSLATSMTWVPSAYCSRTHSQTHMDDYKTGSWVTSQAEVVSWQTLDFIWQPKLSEAFFFLHISRACARSSVYKLSCFPIRLCQSLITYSYHGHQLCLL